MTKKKKISYGIGPYDDGCGFRLVVDFEVLDPRDQFTKDYYPNGRIEIYSNEHATDPHASIDAGRLDELIDVLVDLRGQLKGD
tara:strand:+ start:1370 stop:1618 length:249 start_codon:yes stop_codon:yes gene_type:complete